VSAGAGAVSAGAGAVSAGAGAVSAGANAVTTGADAVTTGADAVSAGADAVANGANAVANVADAVANVADAVANVADAVANGADAVANGADGGQRPFRLGSPKRLSYNRTMSILAGSPFSGSSYPTRMEQNLSTQFGITWPMIVVQVLWLLVILAAILLAIRATLVSARTFRGMLAPLWILLCWLLPIIGPVAALIAAKRQAQSEGRQAA